MVSIIIQYKILQYSYKTIFFPYGKYLVIKFKCFRKIVTFLLNSFNLAFLSDYTPVNCWIIIYISFTDILLTSLLLFSY